MMSLSLFALIASVAFSIVDASASRGFNDKIAWINDLNAAKQEADKPVMVLIHKTWCGACKALKGAFADSSALESAAADFLMVNLEDDEEPGEEAFKPDGSYIPRILFMHKGVVDASIINAGGNPKYKYYYSSVEQVLDSMKQAKAKFAGKSEL
jgi:protein-disulfide reductase (glutathione)